MSIAPELEMIAGRLEDHINDNTARVALAVQTGYDETVIIGTRDAYLRLAKRFIEFVAAAEQGQVQPLNTYGKLLPSIELDVFNRLCELVIHAASLTDTEAQTEEVVYDFLAGSPPHPADVNRIGFLGTSSLP